MCAGDVFSNYTTGIYSTDETASACGGSTNHQIILVGWKRQQWRGCRWILDPPNSWGTGWGESGYMKIKYGTSRVGEGTSYVTVESPSTFYASFTGAGIWQWNGSSWHQLTASNPTMMVASGTTLYGTFGSNASGNGMVLPGIS